MEKKIRAKFECKRVNKVQGREEIEAEPVTGDSEENKTYSKWTPNGSLTLSITNPAAFGFFDPEYEYVVEFTKVLKKSE